MRKKIGDAIPGPPIRFIYSELTPAWVLKRIIKIVNVEPHPESTAIRDLQRAIETYIAKLYGRQQSRFCTKIRDYILDSTPERLLNKAYREPSSEGLLKRVLRKALRESWSIYSKEVPIPPDTRADMVAYKRHRPPANNGSSILDKLRFRKRPKRRLTTYEFLGVELKTAKRSKDPTYRQAAVYTDYFAYSFSVITPLTVLKHGFASTNKFIKEMSSKGMGILLADQHRVIGTILRAERKEISRRNSVRLARKLGLK